MLFFIICLSELWLTEHVSINMHCRWQLNILSKIFSVCTPMPDGGSLVRDYFQKGKKMKKNLKK